MNNIKSDESGTDFEMDYFVYQDRGYHDCIAPGAIKLEEPLSLPLLWNYEPSELIGKCTISDAGDHLHISGHIDYRAPKGEDVAKLLIGSLNGSISYTTDIGFGYDVKSDSWDGRERTIKEMKLWNISLFAAPDESSVDMR